MDDPDDHAELRARAEDAERRLVVQAEVLGVAWRAQIEEERRLAERERSRRRS